MTCSRLSVRVPPALLALLLASAGACGEGSPAPVADPDPGGGAGGMGGGAPSRPRGGAGGAAPVTGGAGGTSTSPPPAGNGDASVVGGAGGGGGAGPAPTAGSTGGRMDGGAGGQGGARIDAGVPDTRSGAEADTAPPMPVDETAYLRRPVPIFWVTVGGQAIKRGVDTPGVLKVIEAHDGTQQLTGIEGRTVALESKIAIEGRGQSSSYYFAQKPYSLELQDDAGMDRDLPLLGMPPESDWVLSSCYADKTCMRNALSYALGREMGAAAGRWAPRTRWVELYVDAKYQGLYLLTERAKGNRHRMNLARPAATRAMGDLTGAYVFSADGDMATYAYNPADPQREWYDARSNRRWKHRFPNRTDVTAEQKQYVSSQFDALQAALVAKNGWRTRIDLQSWLDYYLFTELSNNVDAFFRSWFFYKLPDAMGGKFFMGPLWDYDIAFGNANYAHKYCATNSQLFGSPAPFQTPVNDATFKNELRCRWHELRRNAAPFDVARIEAKLDAFAAHIKDAKARDGRRWGNIGKYVWPNNYVGATWDDDVAYLKFWVRKRLAWVDARLAGQCTTIPAPPAVAAVRPPPPAPNDGRVASAMVDPPQIDLATQPRAYVPIDGPAEARFACPQ